MIDKKTNTQGNSSDLDWLECGNLQGKPLLVLSGWGFQADFFAHIISHLVPERHIICPHYLQESPPKKGLVESASGLAKFIRSLNLKLTPDILGWSLGGMLAMIIAKDFPADFDKVALLSATPCFKARPGYTGGWPESILDRWETGFSKNPEQKLKDFYKQCLSKNEQGVYLSELLKQMPEESSIQGLSPWLNAMWNTDLCFCLSGIQAETLIIQGENDLVVPPAAGKHLEKSIKKSQLLMLPKTGHLAFLSEKDKVSRVLQTFFE